MEIDSEYEKVYITDILFNYLLLLKQVSYRKTKKRLPNNPIYNHIILKNSTNISPFLNSILTKWETLHFALKTLSNSNDSNNNDNVNDNNSLIAKIESLNIAIKSNNDDNNANNFTHSSVNLLDPATITEEEFLDETLSLIHQYLKAANNGNSDYDFSEIIRYEPEHLKILTNLFQTSNKFLNEKQKILKEVKLEITLASFHSEVIRENYINEGLKMNEDEIQIADLNKLNLPIFKDGKLVSYGQMLRRISMSQTFVESMTDFVNKTAKYFKMSKVFNSSTILNQIDSLFEKVISKPIVFQNDDINNDIGFCSFNGNIFVPLKFFEEIQDGHLSDFQLSKTDLDNILDFQFNFLSSSGCRSYYNLITLILMQIGFILLRLNIFRSKDFKRTFEFYDTILEESKAMVEIFQLNDGGIEHQQIFNAILYGSKEKDEDHEDKVVVYFFEMRNWDTTLEEFRKNLDKRISGNGIGNENNNEDDNDGGNGNNGGRRRGGKKRTVKRKILKTYEGFN